MKAGSLRSSVVAAAVAVAVATAGVTAADAAGPQAKRVVGGTVADPAEWPFVAALTHAEEHFCGGIVFAPRHVLTAAHCVIDFRNRKPKGLEVVTGRPDLRRQRDGQEIAVQRISAHRAYRRRAQHDVAVLKLAAETKAQPVALANRKLDAIYTEVGTELRVAGWGGTKANGAEPSPVLLETVETVIDPEPCERAFATYTTEDEICARGNEISEGHYTSSCFGDSGGPFVADTPDGPLVVGVVSYGGRLCGIKLPSVYSRVSNSKPFIRAHSPL